MQKELKKLGDSLKAKRLSLHPTQLGLPDPLSRKDGLSLQEVAVLSGLSLRCVSKLEQGQWNVDNLIPLKRVLKTLLFSSAEQEKLLRMAGWQPIASANLPPQQMKEQLQHLVDSIEHPAYIIDRLWNRVCWNKAAGRLFSHWLGKQANFHNFLEYLLFDPHARLFVCNWETHSAAWCHLFLDHIWPHQEQAAVQEFCRQLSENSPQFKQLLAQHSSQPSSLTINLQYQFQHTKGTKTYNRLAFPVQGMAGWQLSVWLPQKEPKIKALPQATTI